MVARMLFPKTYGDCRLLGTTLKDLAEELIVNGTEVGVRWVSNRCLPESLMT